MLPLGGRRRPEGSGAHAARAAAVRAAALLKRERAECSPSSKPITRAALSARRLSRRGLGLRPIFSYRFTVVVTQDGRLNLTKSRGHPLFFLLY